MKCTCILMVLLNRCGQKSNSQIYLQAIIRGTQDWPAIHREMSLDHLRGIKLYFKNRFYVTLDLLAVKLSYNFFGFHWFVVWLTRSSITSQQQITFRYGLHVIAPWGKERYFQVGQEAGCRTDALETTAFLDLGKHDFISSE